MQEINLLSCAQKKTALNSTLKSHFLITLSILMIVEINSSIVLCNVELSFNNLTKVVIIILINVKILYTNAINASVLRINKILRHMIV